MSVLSGIQRINTFLVDHIATLQPKYSLHSESSSRGLMPTGPTGIITGAIPSASYFIKPEWPADVEDPVRLDRVAYRHSTAVSPGARTCGTQRHLLWHVQ